MNDETIFIGGYRIHPATYSNDIEYFVLENEAGEEMDVSERELTKMLDAFWSKMRD